MIFGNFNLFYLDEFKTLTDSLLRNIFFIPFIFFSFFLNMKTIQCLLILVCLQFISANIDSKKVKCLVCRNVVEEIDNIIQKIDPKKTVAIGGYAIDAKGNQNQKFVSYARSELHLMEMLESVCDKMEDYVRATYKTSGELTLLKLIGPNGQMNPDMGHVDIIQDSDLNKSLKFYCEGIVEEYEDQILRLFGRDAPDIDIALCTDEANLCSQSVQEDYDFEGREEL